MENVPVNIISSEENWKVQRMQMSEQKGPVLKDLKAYATLEGPVSSVFTYLFIHLKTWPTEANRVSTDLAVVISNREFRDILEEIKGACLLNTGGSYAMPTKTMEVMRLPDQGNKMVLDSILTTHERVVQISGLSATFAEIFLEVLQSNLPEGVRLSVREHTEEDFKGRFKARPELEELLAKLN